MFQLVSVMVPTCRKEARNKRKQLIPGGKTFCAGAKSFSNKFVSINFSEGFYLWKKKRLNKRKQFPQDRKTIFWDFRGFAFPNGNYYWN